MAASHQKKGLSIKQWRRRRRLLREGAQVLKEGRRIRRKFGDRLGEDAAEDVDKGLESLKDALQRKRVSQVSDRAEKLDALLDKHLSFGRKSTFREYTESIGVAVLIALVLRAFVVEAFKIPSGSMIPTLEVGDHIFVNKFVYGLRVPLTNYKFIQVRKARRGEVIVFVFPKDESKDFIKRVVAIEGDTVAMRQNVIQINGRPIKRRALPGPCTYTDAEEGSDQGYPKPCTAYEEELDNTTFRVIQDRNGFPMDREPKKVPADHVFVMGDNRDNSHDSRFWGPVPDSHIKGKAMIIWWASGEPDGIRWRRFFNLVHAGPEPAELKKLP